MFTSLVFTGLYTLLLQSSQLAFTQEVKQDANACTTQINSVINREYEWYQIVLFGQPNAKQAPLGSVHFDTDGNPWRKMEPNRWRTGKTKDVGLTWSDTLMNNQSLVYKETGDVEHRGLFATRRALTSEIVPFVGVSLGALQCRLEHLCNRVESSSEIVGTDIEQIGTGVLGCMPFTGASLVSCQKNPEGNLAYDSTSIRQYCNTAKLNMMEHAGQVSLAAVELDAAYRSLYQIAGNFDALLAEGQLPFLDTLQRTVHLMGSFHRLPCLISSCDASPLPKASSSSSSVPPIP